MKFFILVFLLSSVALTEPLWINESRAAVKTLPRDLYIYHWTNADRVGIKPAEVVDPIDPRLFEYARTRTKKFWTHFSQNGAMGEGFYFATDPYSSRDHGAKQGWALIRTILPKGTKYFDLYFNHTQDYTYSPKAILELRQTNCEANGVRELLQHYKESCIAAKRELYSTLGVFTATYIWDGDTVPQCRSRTKHAFYFVSDEIFNAQNTVVFTAETESATVSRDQGLIQKYYSYQKEHSPLWSLDKVPMASEDNFYEWVRTYIAGCGYNREF